MMTGPPTPGAPTPPVVDVPGSDAPSQVAVTGATEPGDLGRGSQGSRVIGLLPLRNRAGDVIAHALVDDDIWPALSVWRWSLDSDGYVTRSEALPGGHQRQVSLHRVVMACATRDGMEVDHIDRDKLNCRRSNLRFVTHLENMHNRRQRARRPKPAPRPRRGSLPKRRRDHWNAEYIRAGNYTWVGSYTTFCTALRALSDARVQS